MHTSDDFSHLLHDQARGVGGHHDAGGAGTPDAHRPGRRSTCPNLPTNRWPWKRPRVWSCKPVAQPATVQDLLRHTAGLTYEFLGTAHVQRLYAKAQIGSRERSNAEFSQTLAALPLLHAARHPLGLQPRHRCAGPTDRSDHRPALGVHLKQAIFDAAGHARHGLSVPEQRPRTASPSPLPTTPMAAFPCACWSRARRRAMEAGGGGLMSTTDRLRPLSAIHAQPR